MERILVSSDHGGFELKSQVINYLDQQKAVDSKVIDLGPFDLDPDDDYPGFAFNLARQVAADSQCLGILICRSGNGMAIAANKVKGARAALCFTKMHAVAAREHNHANILVLDADYQDFIEQKQIIDGFVDSQPEMGGRHQRRVEQITDYEYRN